MINVEEKEEEEDKINFEKIISLIYNEIFIV